MNSPLSFVRGTTLELAVDPEETGKAQPGTGFYHVTTNLPAVLADGRLRSRRELRAAGRQGAGLGGGIRDQASDRVSVGLTLDGALRVLQATRTMAEAVHGQIEAEAALARLKRENQRMLDLVYDEIDARWDDAPDDEEAEGNWSEWAHGELKDGEERAMRAAPGPALYEALRTWEGRLADIASQVSWIDDESCAYVVGFTEPASKFARVRPEAVGLVQLAARKGAGSEQIPVECELRFRPEDLVLVGVWEGR